MASMPMGTSMASTASKPAWDRMGVSQYCRLQSMDTVFTMLDCTTLKMFWMLRRLLGQLMFRPATMPLVWR